MLMHLAATLKIFSKLLELFKRREVMNLVSEVASISN